MRDNWFINFESGSIVESTQPGWLGKETVIEVGYLALQKGDYFKNSTLKLYTNLVLTKAITITPEIIFTDNFRQLFPGLTVKFF